MLTKIDYQMLEQKLIEEFRAYKNEDDMTASIWAKRIIKIIKESQSEPLREGDSTW